MNVDSRARLSYLADIFGRLNDLNLGLQGPNVNLFTVNYKITATVKKLELIISEIDKNTFSLLPTLENFLTENNMNNNEELASDIKHHCSLLINKFKFYFQEDLENQNWIRNPLPSNIPEYFSREQKEQIIDMSSDSTVMENLNKKTLIEFWLQQRTDFKDIANIAIQFLMPFCTTYLCEKGFSQMLYLKNKYRTKLKIEPNLRLKLTDIEPEIEKIVSAKQAQGSH